MNELMESYLNDNLTYVKGQLVDQDITFSDFFNLCLTEYTPTERDLMLFVERLTDY